jgi:hypothetical protein
MRTESQAVAGIRKDGVTQSGYQAQLVPVLALGFASSIFLAVSYSLCVLSFVLFPSLPIAHGVLSLVLPGFTLLTVRSFFLGLIESFAWGWYVSLIFAPLYNYFAIRFGRGNEEQTSRPGHR